MKKLIILILITLATPLVMSLGQFNHVSAMSEQSSMGAVNHGNSTSNSQRCSVSHIGTQAKNSDQSKDVKKPDNEDDEPQPPYYLRLTYSKFATLHCYESLYVPPTNSMKVPLYRLYSVVRR